MRSLCWLNRLHSRSGSCASGLGGSLHHSICDGLTRAVAVRNEALASLADLRTYCMICCSGMRLIHCVPYVPWPHPWPSPRARLRSHRGSEERFTSEVPTSPLILPSAVTLPAAEIICIFITLLLALPSPSSESLVAEHWQAGALASVYASRAFPYSGPPPRADFDSFSSAAHLHIASSYPPLDPVPWTTTAARSARRASTPTIPHLTAPRLTVRTPPLAGSALTPLTTSQV